MAIAPSQWRAMMNDKGDNVSSTMVEMHAHWCWWQCHSEKSNNFHCNNGTPVHQQQQRYHNKGDNASLTTSNMGDDASLTIAEMPLHQQWKWLHHNNGKDACNCKRAYHGAVSPALLPGCMRNRFPCVCHSGAGRWLIWNQLSGDQLISTQSILPRLFSEVLSPQTAPLSCLLLPKLSTLVDCCLGWVVQHLQAFCMLLTAHHHHIVVIPLLPSNCRHPITAAQSQSLNRHHHCRCCCRCRHCRSCPCHCHSPLLLPLPLPLPSPLPLLLPMLSSPSFPLFTPFMCWLLFQEVDKAIATNNGVVVVIMTSTLTETLSLL